MQKLVRGVHHFQNKIFSSQRELFERLAKGQAPETLFITCSDSRINPHLLTKADPGELFILRNAGNIIPPYGAGWGGELATIEYAVTALGVRDIIVCGHTHCGAMSGLLNPDSVTEMPAVEHWLRHAEATRRIMKDNYQHLSGTALLNATVQENVLVQLDHLRIQPAVASRISAGNLHLHGWVYKLESGEVFAYDVDRGEYLPVGEAPAAQAVARPSLIRPI